MKIKYCSNCGSIGDYANANGLKRCSSCKYVGDPLEGGMDEINAFRKKMKTGQGMPSTGLKSFSPPTSQGTGIKPVVNKEWKEKMQSMKGKIIGDDAEIM